MGLVAEDIAQVRDYGCDLGERCRVEGTESETADS
jgi:hypothetical protein